jgi:hypothetical protein
MMSEWDINHRGLLMLMLASVELSCCLLILRRDH